MALANIVLEDFDYAVVVANTGAAPAAVHVTGSGVDTSVTVAPNALETIVLPWVDALKGPSSGGCGATWTLTGSIVAPGSAYHLTSSVPVTVYQFNPLEYHTTGEPAVCDEGENASEPGFSQTNDASLLLPSTAMTGHYRIPGVMAPAMTIPGFGTLPSGQNQYFAVTGTMDGTHVSIHVSSTGQIVAGGGIAATSAGGVVSFTLDQGDVAEVAAPVDVDLSGSLVQADHPVQVISGNPCLSVPAGAAACDHLEESVFPVETLGKHYFVAPPTGPRGDTPGYIVRIYGNVDETHLTYPGGAPAGAPSTIDAGQVVQVGQPMSLTNTLVCTRAFEIEGDHEIEVETAMLSAAFADTDSSGSAEPEGDPSQSQAVAVEQYRTKYVFLAPTNYDINYADVIMPSSANVTLDGAPLTGNSSPIGSGYVVTRAPLDAGGSGSGAHVLISDQPVGLQVIGYGAYTSYQYPGGLNLASIAPPPPLI